MADKHALTLKTPLKDELSVTGMKGYESLGRLFQFDLEVTCANEEIDLDKILGQNVTLNFDIGNGETRYFNGIVSSFSQSGQNQERMAFYQVTLRPWLWFLTRTADCRIFQDESVPDIIKKIFKEHGFTDVEDKLNEPHKSWAYCVQYRETDFNFVSRLMEEEGIYYYFTHEDGKHTLVLADSGSAHQSIRGEAVKYYPATAKSSMVGEAFVSEWSMRSEVQPGAFASNDYDYKRPKAALRVREQKQEKHAGADYEIYDYPGEYAGRFEGTKGEYADMRIEELHVQHTQADGLTDLRIMATGGLFKLDNHPRKDQNKEYLVIDTAYDFAPTGGSSSGTVFECQFTAIDSKTSFRPSRATPKPVIQGPQTAVVVDAGPDPEKYARIKVQFFWDREGQDKSLNACWVRESQNSAGTGWGSVFPPHVGHEVIVSFLEGDPDQPIITGRVYNADNMPPGPWSGTIDSSVITDHGDNEFILEGKDGEQQVHIKQSCGNEMLFDGKTGEPSILIQQACGNKILMEGKGGAEKITIADVGENNKLTMDPNLPSIRLESKGNNSEWEMGIGSNGKIGFQKKTDGDWYEHTSGNKVKTMVGTEASFNLSGKTETTVGLKHETFIGGKISINASKEFEKNLLKFIKKSRDEIKYDSEKKIWLIGGPGDEAQLILDANGAKLFSKKAELVLHDKGGAKIDAQKNIDLKSKQVIKIGKKASFKGDGSLVEIKTKLKHPNFTASK